MESNMDFSLYRIKNSKLKPYVSYILFNQSLDPEDQTTVTSYANTNICLGIIKDKKLLHCGKQIETESSPDLYSYLSGMYMKPHIFKNKGCLDEICIDFSPQGYYRFFHQPFTTYILDGDPLRDLFGKEGKLFFQDLFSIGDLQVRGQRIEQFLLERINTSRVTFLDHCLAHMYQSKGQITLSSLAQVMNCSERKINRHFNAHLDVSPKAFSRILRFRHALRRLKELPQTSLTSICYQLEYYDQSHFNKDIRFFTNLTPKQFVESIIPIEDQVMVSVR